MPMPRWVTKITKNVFNPMQLERGEWPVLTHRGRVSGQTYRTPLDAVRIDDGYLFFVVYGPRTDWVRNIEATGSAVLTIGGDDIPLTGPRLIGLNEAKALAPEGTKFPPAFARVSDFLKMDLAEAR